MRIRLVTTGTRERAAQPCPARWFFKGRSHRAYGLGVMRAREAGHVVEWKIITPVGVFDEYDDVPAHVQCFSTMKRNDALDSIRDKVLPIHNPFTDVNIICLRPAAVCRELAVPRDMAKPTVFIDADPIETWGTNVVVLEWSMDIEQKYQSSRSCAAALLAGDLIQAFPDPARPTAAEVSGVLSALVKERPPGSTPAAGGTCTQALTSPGSLRRDAAGSRLTGLPQCRSLPMPSWPVP